MAVTYNQLIARNKRNSVILIAVFSLLVMAVGGSLGYAIANLHGAGETAPQVAVLYTLGAMVIALVSSLVSYYAGPSAILAMSRARRIEKSDDPQFFNVVEEMAIAGGIPCPKIYLIDDTAPNAFATGRDPAHGVLAITTGLRNKLTREELQGVVAHEMAHIRHFDIRFAVLMATLVGVIVLLCDIFLRSLRWGRWSGGRRSRRSKGGGGGALVLILILVAIILSIVAPILAKIIEMAFSRQREYLADAGAVDLTRNPEGLAKALVKIRDDPEVLEVANRATAPMYIVHPIKRFEERGSSIMDSHPPIEDRVQRLMSLMTTAEVGRSAN